MKMEKSQQTHRNAKETTISNYMPIKWTIWKKWIIFYNLIIYIYIYIGYVGFSLAVASRLLSSCGAWVSYCGSFYCCRA